MIAEADAANRGGDGRLDFVAIIRAVADTRHVSVNEILSPAPHVSFRYSPWLGCTSEHLDFDPYAGWSWRQVLVWSSDATRVARRRKEAEETDAWKAQAQQNLRFGGL